MNKTDCNVTYGSSNSMITYNAKLATICIYVIVKPEYYYGFSKKISKEGKCAYLLLFLLLLQFLQFLGVIFVPPTLDHHLSPDPRLKNEWNNKY